MDPIVVPGGATLELNSGAALMNATLTSPINGTLQVSAPLTRMGDLTVNGTPLLNAELTAGGNFTLSIGATTTHTQGDKDASLVTTGTLSVQGVVDVSGKGCGATTRFDIQQGACVSGVTTYGGGGSHGGAGGSANIGVFDSQDTPQYFGPHSTNSNIVIVADAQARFIAPGFRLNLARQGAFALEPFLQRFVFARQLVGVYEPALQGDGDGPRARAVSMPPPLVRDLLGITASFAYSSRSRFCTPRSERYLRRAMALSVKPYGYIDQRLVLDIREPRYAAGGARLDLPDFGVYPALLVEQHRAQGRDQLRVGRGFEHVPVDGLGRARSAQARARRSHPCTVTRRLFLPAASRPYLPRRVHARHPRELDVEYHECGAALARKLHGAAPVISLDDRTRLGEVVRYDRAEVLALKHHVFGNQYAHSLPKDEG